MSRKNTECPEVQGRTRRILVETSQISADERNRAIAEDEDFGALVESIRVLGILQPLHVQSQADGSYRLIDGERRFRAAQKAGIEQVPCDVWPENAAISDALVAGIVLNEQRKAHSCIHVARRLRELKNELDLTHEEVASRTGLPLDRVKLYLSVLCGASETLLSFFEENEVPLKVAAEFMRYEKSTNEARTRKLVERYRESPLSRLELIALRKKESGQREKRATPIDAKAHGFSNRLEAAFRRDAARARTELEATLSRLGFRLIALQEPEIQKVARATE
jgi:ParB/RepB/Spo0J family partition protein